MSHTLLSHTKVTGTTTSFVDITGIDQTYQDLCYWFVGHASDTGTYTNPETYTLFNNDSGANHTAQRVWTHGTGKYASNTDNANEFWFAGLGNKQHSNNSGGTIFGYIPNYTATTNYQGHTFWAWGGTVSNSSVGATGAMILQYTGQWTQEAAINQIEFGYPAGGIYIAQNSTFSLYGVKNS